VEGQPNWAKLDNHYSISLLAVRRWIFLPNRVIRPNAHLGFGFSVMNESVIENGTTWNFNFVGGGGLEYDVIKKWTVYGDVRWEHFSNGGQVYLTNKDVIGPESVNIVLGIRYLL
jgi:opacity protein-like surface antigen